MLEFISSGLVKILPHHHDGVSATLNFQGKLTNTIDKIIPSGGLAAVSIQYTRPLITQLPLALRGIW